MAGNPPGRPDARHVLFCANPRFFQHAAVACVSLYPAPQFIILSVAGKLPDRLRALAGRPA